MDDVDKKSSYALQLFVVEKVGRLTNSPQLLEVGTGLIPLVLSA